MRGSWWLPLLWFAVLPGFTCAEPAPTYIAIILDDLGNDEAAGMRALALPGAVTYAILPRLAHTALLAERAHAQGREVMLHLPMQAITGKALGPDGLTMDMTAPAFHATIADALASVPYVRGVNNHMGSLLTRHPGAMQWLMQALHRRGDLYFVDSRTNEHTVAELFARSTGLATSRRDVFLDNRRDSTYIRAQLTDLIRKARLQGSAIGIGHPYPETLDVLAAELPRLAAQNVQLVPVSQLLDQQRRKVWPASSSPLPTVAKSLKP